VRSHGVSCVPRTHALCGLVKCPVFTGRTPCAVSLDVIELRSKVHGGCGNITPHAPPAIVQGLVAPSPVSLRFSRAWWLTHIAASLKLYRRRPTHPYEGIQGNRRDYLKVIAGRRRCGLISRYAKVVSNRDCQGSPLSVRGSAPDSQQLQWTYTERINAPYIPHAPPA